MSISLQCVYQLVCSVNNQLICGEFKYTHVFIPTCCNVVSISVAESNYQLSFCLFETVLYCVVMTHSLIISMNEIHLFPHFSYPVCMEFAYSP